MKVFVLLLLLIPSCLVGQNEFDVEKLIELSKTTKPNVFKPIKVNISRFFSGKSLEFSSSRYGGLRHKIRKDLFLFSSLNVFCQKNNLSLKYDGNLLILLEGDNQIDTILNSPGRPEIMDFTIVNKSHVLVISKVNDRIYYFNFKKNDNKWLLVSMDTIGVSRSYHPYRPKLWSNNKLFGAKRAKEYYRIIGVDSVEITSLGVKSLIQINSWEYR